MKILSLLLALTFGCGIISAEDNPITANTAVITITLKSSDPGIPLCTFIASSASYNVAQNSNVDSSSTGSGAPKATFNPMNVVKPVDLCSAPMFYQTASATYYTEVLVIITPPATATKQSTFALRLGNGFIKQLTDSAADGRAIQELVEFEYDDLTTAELSPTGDLLSCRGWNVKTNSTDTSHCSELKGK